MSIWRGSIAAGLMVGLLAAAACTGSDDLDPPVGSGQGSDAVSAPTGPVGTGSPASGGPATDGPSNSAVATTDDTTTIATVPDDGVPGIDSTDAFCRSWSEFAGSFQALSLATAFGSDPDAATRLEVAAAPALIAAVDGLDANLPAELEAERVALVTELAGPMVRRAELARTDLAAAGMSAEAIAALGNLWLAALTAAGLDEPDIVLDLPEAEFAGFDDAVTAFAAARPPINQDPSLITSAAIPLTERYLGANCPDQGTLGGNDVIDEL